MEYFETRCRGCSVTKRRTIFVLSDGRRRNHPFAANNGVRPTLLVLGSRIKLTLGSLACRWPGRGVLAHSSRCKSVHAWLWHPSGLGGTRAHAEAAGYIMFFQRKCSIITAKIHRENVDLRNLANTTIDSLQKPRLLSSTKTDLEAWSTTGGTPLAVHSSNLALALALHLSCGQHSKAQISGKTLTTWFLLEIRREARVRRATVQVR